MFKVVVDFNFDTKEEWLEFGKKFIEKEDFAKYSPIIKGIKEHNQRFSEAVDFYFKKDMMFILQSCEFFATKSEKALKILYNWIKENHYENNYQLKDKWGNKLRMTFGELFE